MRLGGAIEAARVDWHAFEYYRRLGRLRHYVAEHLSEPISLADAAGVAALERTYFSKFFHDKTGVCFKDWLALERIRRAVEMIGRRNLAITAVAARVGYGDLRSFERAFRRCTGLTPRGYRRMIRRRLTGDRRAAPAAGPGQAQRAPEIRQHAPTPPRRRALASKTTENLT